METRLPKILIELEDDDDDGWRWRNEDGTPKIGRPAIFFPSKCYNAKGEKHHSLKEKHNHTHEKHSMGKRAL